MSGDPNQHQHQQHQTSSEEQHSKSSVPTSNINSFSMANRFQSFGLSLRQSAQDMTAKATSELTKVARVAGGPTMTTTTAGDIITATTPEESTTMLQLNNGTTITTAAAAAITTTTNSTMSSPDQTNIATATSNSNNNNATNVKELVEKMSQKIKALTVIRQQLQHQVETVEDEKKQLLNFVTEEILNHSIVLDDNTKTTAQSIPHILPQLQQAWRQQDEQTNLTLQHMQVEFQKLAAEANQAKAELLQHQQQPSSLVNHDNNDTTTTIATTTTTTPVDWEQEKATLLQTHAEMVQSIHDDHQVKLTLVREEAMQKLTDFKQKVAAARLAEVTKLRQEAKQEAAIAAKKIMEQKLREQKESFQMQWQTAMATQQQQQTKNDNSEQQQKQQQQEEALLQLRNEYEQLIAQTAQETARRIADLEEQLAISQNQNNDPTHQPNVSSPLMEQQQQRQQQLELEKLQLQDQLLQESQQAAQRIHELEQYLDLLQNETRASAETDQAAAVTRIQQLETSVQTLETERTNLVLMLQQQQQQQTEPFVVRIQELETMLSQLQEKYDTMVHTAESTRAAATQLASAEMKLAQMEIALARMQEEHQAGQALNQQQQQASAQVNAETLALLHAKDIALEQVQTELQQRTMELTTQQDQVETLRGELQEMKQQQHAHPVENVAKAALMEKELSEQRESYEQQIVLLQQESQTNLRALENIIEVLHLKDIALEQVQTELQQRTMELITQQDQVETLRGALQEMKQQQQAHPVENVAKAALMEKELSEQRESYEQQIVLLQQESQTNLRALENIIEALRHEIAQSSQRGTVTNDTNHSLQTQLDVLTNELSQTTTSYQTALAQMQNELQKEKDHASILQQEQAALLERWKEEKTRSSSSDGTAARCIDLENQLANLTRVVQEIGASKASVEAEYATLQTSYDELQQELAALKDSGLTLAAQGQEQALLAQLQVHNAELTKELEDLREKLEQGNNSLQAKGAEIDLLQAKLVDVEANREMLVSKVTELKETTAKMQEVGEDVQKLRVTIVELEKAKADLSSRLETAQASFASEREKMRLAMESHVDNMTKQFKTKLEATKAKALEDVNALQATVKEKDEKLSSLVGKLKSLTAGAAKLKEENEGLKKRLESEMSKQKSLHSQLEAAQKRIEETAANGSATASSLLKHQETLEKQKAELQNRAKQLKDELSIKANKVEELTGKLQALSDNMNVLTNDLRTKDEKLEMASKLEARLKTSEEEVTRLREQVNKLKLEQIKNATLVEKLQSEKEANEQSQGERTAIVGMLEGQIAEISEKLSDATTKLEAALYDVQQKEEELQSAASEIEKFKAQIVEISEETKRSSEALAAAQKGADAKSTKALEAIQKELQLTKQQMARKSAAAQRLLQQREAECAQLRKTNKDLQQEVDKGSYSDRKIFELAALQSNRETQQVSEIELRDSIIERLKHALLQRDGDLASVEKHAREIEGQIEELCRIQRREDVNLDYLKNIVVKYLSFPSGSTERAGLLRVLATLLQFDDKDYKTIEEGKNKVSWWGGAVIPTMIATSPKSGPATTGSAEVSISSTSTSAKPATSLQF